ncbi:MAG: histidine phosphatase family protein [Spirochaetales bacterium]|nr:histidine phosphatase family protein [Spirochaetales bacterium]
MFITLIRHSSAVHDNSFDDFKRELSSKGIEKAKKNAQAVKEQGWVPDLIISSPADRAIQTAQIFLKPFEDKFNEEDIIQIKSLYLPTPDDILNCIRSIDDSYSDVFIFSHNNGISWAAQQLCNNQNIIMPTCSAVRIKFDKESWTNIDFGTGKKENFLL